jgi:hypothetical protein
MFQTAKFRPSLFQQIKTVEKRANQKNEFFDPEKLVSGPFSGVDPWKYFLVRLISEPVAQVSLLQSPKWTWLPMSA